MTVTETKLPGLLIIEPKVFSDARGYFYESYNRKNYLEKGIETVFVQDNQSKSTYGVIRGLHYQLPPNAQTKLVRALQGTILDVAVDIRKNSPTYGQVFYLELSEENKKQLYIPHGFAHGFSVLSETAVVSYKCDSYYSPQSERGIRFDDPSLEIDWKVPLDKAIVSEKDIKNPLLKEAENTF
jgi:dTDP-4-dehydrorhamnose 3,5-epimerase